MKFFIGFIIGWMVFVVEGAAQNRSITFEPKDWKQAVEKAKGENKLIFLDCYTSWCGPCKNLAANIFTRDAVADFYNRYFVNVSMDMEKDVDGVMLSKVYQPDAYPTLFFIDPYTQSVVHRETGGGDVRYVLSIAETALKSENTLAGSCNRYKKGDRSPEFVRKLMQDLQLAGTGEMHRQVAEAYFEGLNEQELLHKENWELFKVHIDDPYAKVFSKVLDQQGRFAALFGEKEVALSLQWVVILELGNIAGQSARTDPEQTEACYQKLIDVLIRAEFPGATALLTDAYFSKALAGNCGEAWRAILNGYRYNLSGDEYYSVPCFSIFYPLASWVPFMGERVVLTELLDLLDRIKLRCVSMPYLARLALNKALVYKKLGDMEKARQAREEYGQYCTMR